VSPEDQDQQAVPAERDDIAANVDGADGADLEPPSSQQLTVAEEPEPSPDAASSPSGEPLSAPVELSAVEAAIEAILFVVEAPVSIAALAVAVQQPIDVVSAAVDQLRTGYDDRRAGIELRAVAGGVRIYTRADFAGAVETFLQDGQRSRLTQAALETLAVIAYRQPVTRSRVSAIRGVNVDGVVRTLATRGLIVEVGSDPETGGGLFRTTDLFLEKLGLESLTELPSLAPLLPELDGLSSDEL
jgi:segregation and condensation protein B